MQIHTWTAWNINSSVLLGENLTTIILGLPYPAFPDFPAPVKSNPRLPECAGRGVHAEIRWSASVQSLHPHDCSLHYLKLILL